MLRFGLERLKIQNSKLAHGRTYDVPPDKRKDPPPEKITIKIICMYVGMYV